MAKYETLNVKPQCKKSIDKLANKFDMSKVDFIDRMVFYFEKTGLNPQDVKVLSVAEELNKFRDTIISFIRKQEKDFILPTFGKMDTLIIRMKEYIDEEAPKNGDPGMQNKSKSLLINSMVGENRNSETQEIVLPDKSLVEENNELINKNEKLEMVLSTTMKYFDNLLSHIEEKSTGLTRKPVVELPIGEINDYREFLKKFSDVRKDSFR